MSYFSYIISYISCNLAKLFLETSDSKGSGPRLRFIVGRRRLPEDCSYMLRRKRPTE